MRLNAVFPLLMLVMVSGCRAGEAQTPEDTGEMPYGEVGFAFFTPKALPAVVTKALIIDNEKVVSTYRTLDSTPGDPDTTQIWNNRVRMHAQFNKARHPPALMLFCWDSVIDKKTYETRITFSSALRKKCRYQPAKIGEEIPPGIKHYYLVWHLKAKCASGSRTAARPLICRLNR
ncbi:hypothetical protein BW31_02499 [Pantoea agglomerans]|nr:hypothetical protein BW31_02499 [Pantoea agglomerans]